MSDFSPPMARFAYGRMEISHLGIEPATIGLPLDTLPPSSISLGSSRTKRLIVFNSSFVEDNLR